MIEGEVLTLDEFRKKINNKIKNEIKFLKTIINDDEDKNCPCSICKRIKKLNKQINLNPCILKEQ